MAERAAHLVDSVFPHVPIRQWVLSLPFKARYCLAWNHDLTRAVLDVFWREVERRYRRRALEKGHKNPKAGGVTVIQRAGGAINLNVHFHMAALDGVFCEKIDGSLVFHRVNAPSTAEVEEIARTVSRKIIRLFERKGLSLTDNEDAADPLERTHPALAQANSASIAQVIAFGKYRGQKVAQLLDLLDDHSAQTPPIKRKRHASIDGFDLHAGAPVPAHDRNRLERLLRYLLRPPIAESRMRKLPDGRIALNLKTKWRNGATHVVFDPVDLIGKIAAIIPRPHINLIIYHGVLAPRAKWRKRAVVYGRPVPTLAVENADEENPVETKEPGRYTDWATLMKRTFGLDVLECPKCHGRMKLIALIDQPAVIQKILKHLGLPADIPRARPPPKDRQLGFWDEASSQSPGDAFDYQVYSDCDIYDPESYAE